MSFYFHKQKIGILKSSDFNLDTDNKITIKKRDLTLVLFKDKSYLSEQTALILQNIFNKIVGIDICFCNVDEESEIRTCISNFSNDVSSYQRIFRHSLPFIVIYKDGEPQDVYRGVISEGRIINYCFALTSK